MTQKKIVPWLMAASILLSATSMVAFNMPAANALTSVEELTDVDSSHWAYQALADLVEKYDVIEGYPDYTFKGNKAPTRWELAAALNALMKSVGRDLARLGAEKADKSDLMKLARLQEEFKRELEVLNSRVDALEDRASAIEAKNSEQDTRLDLLEKTQLHGDFSFGMLWDAGGAGLGGTAAANGIQDSLSALGRLRLGLKVPVVESYDNSRVGEGDVVARLVGAFGRWSPQRNGSNAQAGTAGPISGYSAIAGGASAANEGPGTSSFLLGPGIGAANGINTRQNIYVESAYYQQAFKPGIPIITDLTPGFDLFPDNDRFRSTADLYVGIVPWRNLFARSPYKGDELNQFQNTALVGNAGILVNNINPTIAHSWHQGLGEHFSLDTTGAIGSGIASDVMGGLWATEEMALNYDTGFLFDSFTKPGTLYAGAYHFFNEGTTNLNQFVTAGTGLGPLNREGETLLRGANGNQNINGFYVGWNQEWWRGIGTSVDWSLNEAGQGNDNNAILNSLRNGTGAQANFFASRTMIGIQNALSTTLSVPLTAFDQDLTKRSKDAIGVGYALINPTEIGEANGVAAPGRLTIGRGNEHVLEAFYRFAVNDNMTIIPSAQVIINRGGITQNNGTFVLGLRTNYVF
ncbi:MAG: carbohydrate porin [Cyanobacteria bacterium HKST-UBA06]|nr:carbohydrate porin [Cyanobacteria bacterium HKST-UBA05]MCA9798061.1 carbohydrate porin [Cyanobacteria bacterium HKST-UBA04]MCA9807082.1 carbohydrate porin [Cyanobacteria bacterium HKST-UBA06]MCA9842209.1 carbohydrate porin [Cyanobacteria bacterium HKST-UBA03]